MSKGNIYLGYARGAIGDLVLTRMKGQQIGRARNRNPANPRSFSQMKQRAGFVSPLKFYTRGVQNLFQFAFADKREKESDYNAFMRINVGAGFPLTPDEFRNQGFPAFGNWILSRGNLPSLPVTMIGNHSNNLGIWLDVDDAPTTVAGLTAALFNRHLVDWMDLITFVFVDADGCITSAQAIDLWPSASVRWTIEQVWMNPNDQRPLSEALPAFDVFSVDGEYYFGVSAERAPINETSVGLGVIRSVAAGRRFRVSTSRIVCGGYINDYIQFRNTPEEVKRVVAEWGATYAPILKGGLL